MKCVVQYLDQGFSHCSYNSSSWLPLVILSDADFVNRSVLHDDKIHVDSFGYASNFEVPKTHDVLKYAN